MQETERSTPRERDEGTTAPDAGARTPEGGAPAAGETAVEYDRRGVALPPRQRVGGIITPQ